MLFPYIDSWKTEILLMNVFTGTQEYPSARKTNNQTRNANDSYKRTRSWKLSLGWTYYQTTIDRFGRVDSTLVIIHLMWLNNAFESSIDTGPVHTWSKKFEKACSNHRPFWICVWGSLVREITWLLWRYRFRKASKCFPSTQNAKPAFSNSSGLMNIFKTNLLTKKRNETIKFSIPKKTLYN